MAVLLANATLTTHIRTHPFTRDGHGVPVASATTVTRGPYPGAANEQDDGTWTLRLDPRTWRVRGDDTVTDDAGRTWVVIGAQNHYIPGYSAVDYVSCTATLEPPDVP